MSEHPILFSGPMVRAILDGRKTQTRRVVRRTDAGRVKTAGSPSNWHLEDPDAVKACPYGSRGDTLWVRETFQLDPARKLPTCYRARGCTCGFEHAWRPAIFMPRVCSRLSLRIADVRVQRLQEISEEDAIAEGIPRIPDTELVCHCGSELAGHSWGDGHFFTPMPEHRHEFSKAWDTINGKRAPWASNQWVWAVSFERLKQ